MTKEYLLSKTLYGVDIIQHLIRKEFPDFVMRVSGTDCGQCPRPRLGRRQHHRSDDGPHSRRRPAPP